MNAKCTKKSAVLYAVVFLMLCLAGFVLFGRGFIADADFAPDTYIGGKGCKLIFIKEWNDNGNADGTRPDEVDFTVDLEYPEGGNSLRPDVPIKLTAEDNWIYTYPDYMAYHSGSAEEKTDLSELGYTYAGEDVSWYDMDESSTEMYSRTILVTLKNTKAGMAVDTGILVVSEYTGGNAADMNKQFHFTVTLDDKSINGTYGNMNFENGVASFTLSNGENRVATGIPDGTGYTVEEAEANLDGYETTMVGSNGTVTAQMARAAGSDALVGRGTITAGQPQFADYYNYRESYLILTKNVRGSESSKYDKFDFEIEAIGNPTLSGYFSPVTFNNGVGTFSGVYGDGSSQTVAGLPEGRYTITELENKRGYTAETPPQTVTVTYGNNILDPDATANFINTKGSYVEVSSAKLGINGVKTLKGRDFRPGDHFTFELRVTGSTTYDNLPDKTICEITPNSGNNAPIEFGTFTFSKAGKYQYIISEYNPQNSGIEIIPGMTYDTTAYRLTVTVEKGTDKNKLYISNVKIERSDRQAPDSWSEVYNDSPDKIDKQYCNFTNSFQEAQAVSLTGHKELVNKSLQDNSYTFYLTAVGAKNDNGEYVEDIKQPMPNGVTVEEYGRKVYPADSLQTGGILFPNLVFTADLAGNEYRYTITEEQPVYSDGTPYDGAVTNDDGKLVYRGLTYDNHKHIVDVKVTLEDDGTGNKVVKAIVTHDEHYGDGVVMNNFVFTNVYNASAQLPLTGTKTLAGREFKAGDSFTFLITPVDGAPAPVDTLGTAVSKVTINPEGGNEGTINFGTLNFDAADMGNQQEKVFEYKISEEAGTLEHMKYDTEEKLVQVKVTDDGYGNMTAVLVTDANGPTWKNTYDPDYVNNPTGNIKISKTVAGNAGEATKAFDFRLELSDKTITGKYGDLDIADGVATFALKHGESVTAAGLPVDINYTVTETDYSADGYVTTATGDTGTVENGKTAAAEFTNTKNTTSPVPETGALTITKRVAGTAGEADRDFYFAVTLSDNTITGSYGDLEFKDGTATFTLKSGEKKTAAGLPAGITYTVQENDYAPEGYVTTATGSTGTIEKDVTAAAIFTNAKNAVPADAGSLTVSKAVSGDAADFNKDFHFVITLSGEYTVPAAVDDAADEEKPEDEENAAEGEGTDPDDNTSTGDDANTDNNTNTDVNSDVTNDEGTPADDASPVVEAEPRNEAGVFSRISLARLFAEYIGDGTDNAGETAGEPVGGTAPVEGTPTEGAPVEGAPADGTPVEDTAPVNGIAPAENTPPIDSVASAEKITGTFGEIGFTNGVANITLKNGQTLTAYGLPVGISYTVTETEAN